MFISRSTLLSLKGYIHFYCDITPYSLVYTWSLFKNDTLNQRIIDLSSNPTKHSSELVMKPFQLEYGLYEFQLQVKISDNGLVRSTSKFVQITKTGLAVYGLQIVYLVL